MDKLLNTGLGHLSLFSIMTSPINVIFGTASLLVHNYRKMSSATMAFCFYCNLLDGASRCVSPLVLSAFFMVSRFTIPPFDAKEWLLSLIVELPGDTFIVFVT